MSEKVRLKHKGTGEVIYAHRLTDEQRSAFNWRTADWYSKAMYHDIGTSKVELYYSPAYEEAPEYESKSAYVPYEYLMKNYVKSNYPTWSLGVMDTSGTGS